MLRSFAFCLLFVVQLGAYAQDTLILHYDQTLRETEDRTAPNRGILVREGEGWRANVFSVASGVQLMSGYYRPDHVTQEGPFTYYHENGALNSHGYYHEGRHVGPWKGWDSLGRLSDSFFFENDTLRANMSWSYDEDNRTRQCFFNDNRNGQRILVNFRPDGTMASRTEWQGKRRETLTYWDNDSVATYVVADSTQPERVAYFSPQGKQVSETAYRKIVMETVPVFPGGRAALEQYLEDDLRKRNAGAEVESPVLVTIVFSLYADGKARDIHILQDEPNAVFRQRATESIKAMPAWNMKGHHSWGPFSFAFKFNL